MATGRSYAGIIVIIIGLILAVVVGSGLVTSQMLTLLQFSAVLVLLICFLLGRKIWLLIPLLSSMGLTLQIPGQPSTMMLAQVLFISFSVVLLLMRRLPFRLQFTELEGWMVVITLCVVQVYARNPVGVGLFGGDTVGGKTYAIFALSLVSACVLAGLKVPASELKAALRLSILGGILSFGLHLVGQLFPSIGFYYGAVKAHSSDSSAPVDPTRATRINFLGKAADDLALWVTAFISPLRTLLRPGWFFLTLLAVGFAAMSGYRNNIASAGLILLFGLLYRGGVMHVLISVAIGLVSLATLAIVNSAAPLPPNAQRALSFLPGTWEDDIRRDAQESTDWRLEIWEEVLLTDRWIENKWLGDGLGYTRRELEAQLALREGVRLRGTSGFDAQRESILASGDYHSGPVQTIRVVGYVGLVLLLVAMFRLAVHAHRLIIRCRGTDWLPVALFFGVPLIVQPIFFVLIFGTFQIGSATTLMGLAMIRLLEENLPLQSRYAGSPARSTVPGRVLEKGSRLSVG